MSILVIDHTGNNDGALASGVRAAGYGDARSADSVASGMDMLGNDYEPDLVLIDFDRGGDNPLEIVKALRSDHAATNLPLVIACDESDIDVLDAVLQLGPIDCLVKPIRPTELSARIRNGVLLGQEIRKRRGHEESAEKARRKVKDIRHMLNKVTNLDDDTGIPNRRYFDVTYSKEWQRAARDDLPLSVILIRVMVEGAHTTKMDKACRSFFKEVAMAIDQAAKRPGDLVARYTKTEFAALLPSTALGGAMAVAEEMLSRVRVARTRHLVGLDKGLAEWVFFGVSSAVPRLGEAMDKLLVQAAESLD